MKSASRTVLSMLCFFLFAGLALADSVAIAVPSPGTTTVGSTIVVDVNISSIADLYAFQLDLAFNPAVLSAVSVSEGSFLPSGGTTSFVPGSIDNVGGSITFNADTLIGTIPGVTGGGSLLSFDFLAIGNGVSALNLQNALFLDSSLNNLSVTMQNGSATVNSAVVSTPEPASSLLILVGALAAGVLLKLRR